MNNAIKNVFIFALGGAVGSAATWFVVKKKYAELAQAEIDDVKETYKARYENKNEAPDESEKPQIVENEEVEDTEDDRSTIRYNQIIRDAGYADGPYVISPDEFGDKEEYTRLEYTYYSDKVLTDDYDNPVDDVDNTVGYDSLCHFGEYEDDAVHIRNDRLKCYIEILLDERKYSDVIKTKPRQVEV